MTYKKVLELIEELVYYERKNLFKSLLKQYDNDTDMKEAIIYQQSLIDDLFDDTEVRSVLIESTSFIDSIQELVDEGFVTSTKSKKLTKEIQLVIDKKDVSSDNKLSEIQVLLNEFKGG